MAYLDDLNDLFKKGPASGWADVSSSLGNEFYDLDGRLIRRGDYYSSAERRLPIVLRPDALAVGDMIPGTSWGSSLANLLVKSSWDEIRHPLISDRSNVCELCGDKLKTLDVHEIWRYDFPPDEEMKQAESALVMGYQRLDGFMVVCHECHLCFHLGKANVDGMLERTHARLAAINHWTRKTVEDYCRTIGNRWKHASQIYWILDLTKLSHPSGGLIIKSPWREHPENPGFLTMQSRLGDENLTVIAGISWKFSSDKAWKDPVPIEAFQ